MKFIETKMNELKLKEIQNEIKSNRYKIYTELQNLEL